MASRPSARPRSQGGLSPARKPAEAGPSPMTSSAPALAKAGQPGEVSRAVCRRSVDAIGVHDLAGIVDMAEADQVAQLVQEYPAPTLRSEAGWEGTTGIERDHAADDGLHSLLAGEEETGFPLDVSAQVDVGLSWPGP